MTVVVGVDGAGRTHRLNQLAAAAAGPVVRLSPPLGAGLADLLAAASGDGRLVLVDDAHRLGGEELTALAAAARQGCRMVVARRPTISSRELAELDEAAAARGTVEQLDPLTVEAVAVFVGSLTGRQPAKEVATALHIASAGLPGVLASIAGGAPDTSSPSLIARVQRRLAMLHPAVAGLARLLALRLELADGVLAAASELDTRADAGPDGPGEGAAVTSAAGAAPDFAGAMRVLRDEGLLIPGAEAMIPAVAHAILAELPAAERRRVHEVVARALLAAGTDVGAAAAQLRAARAFTPAAAGVYRTVGDRTRFADPAAALGWYDDAVEAGAGPADVAAGRAEAAALLGLPVDSGQPVAATDAGRLVLVDGAVEAHQGRADRSAQALVGARPPGPELAVAALVAVGRLAEARSAAPNQAGPNQAAPSSAPNRATPLDETASLGMVGLRRLAEGALMAASDPAASVALLIEAAEALERTPPAVVLPDTAHALGAVLASATGDVASAEYLLDRALATGAGGPVAVHRHRLLLAWVRMRAGRYDTAVAELARLARADLPGRDRFLLAAISAGVARRSGDVARLRDAWATVEPVLARRAVDLFAVEAVEELAVAATRLRRYARVAPVLDALDGIVAALGQPPAWTVSVGWVRLQVAIAAEDAVAAADVAGRMAQACAAGTGARPRAQCAAAGLWARVLAGDVDAGAAITVADDLVTAQLPWEASRLVGQAAIRTADPVTARRLLERARDLSSAEVSTDRRAEAQQHGGLSEREVEVARMVLAGDTYREIGGRLFISPKTVEHHVARIRNKLGATTRAEFLAALRDTLTDPAQDSS